MIEGRVSHFMFANDLILFCKNEDSSLRNLLLLLKYFELVAGLKVNLAKSSILCLKTDQDLSNNLTLEIECQVSSFSMSYLGLPLRAGKLCRADWLQLISRFDARLGNWHGQLLSRADRLTLINSVITASTAYLLSLFQAPKWVLNRIDSRRQKFFWVGQDNISTNGKCLVSWDSITCSKIEGGLGILDLRAHNQARLGTWLWRMRSQMRWFYDRHPFGPRTGQGCDGIATALSAVAK
ncbi:hypothetical protein Cni_G03426 [Canna indica]|uniref:Reverse transcriptase domain-containing protein n=1 Tax=Canna indica TaxID=4628 RepID=A0AAQ3JTW6_9LILI|nr:hypothetical protein Cni_G03426 [Canna indica]